MPRSTRRTLIDYPGLIEELAQPATSKLVLVVLDGLGGLPRESGGPTELEAASTPNLDSLARSSEVGSLIPVTPGVAPGSGPAHFALFGYDPVEYDMGRGILEASGVGFEMTPRDVAVRGNFATVDGDGLLVDRRAGRIPTSDNRRLCRRLQEEVRIDGVEVFVEPVSEHRLLVVFRAEGLSDAVSETDPQQTGVAPLAPQALEDAAAKTARVAASFLEQAAALLADEPRANMVTLRGFAAHRTLPSLTERFHLRALCLANYPMYRGVSRLVGMDLYEVVADLEAQVEALADNFDRYDFFFLHFKATDKAGEDGDFEAKVAAIESVDPLMAPILELHPDVLAVTGDHSTPAPLRSHSWHPVPLLINSRHCRPDPAVSFGEAACRSGALGMIPSKSLLPLMLAHGGRLAKFGA